MMLLALMRTMEIPCAAPTAAVSADRTAPAALPAPPADPVLPAPAPVCPGEAVLDAQGVIQECDESFARRFGYAASQVPGRHLSELLPELADVELLPDGHLNERLHFFCHIGKRFRALRRDGIQFAIRLFLTMIGSDDAPRLRMLVSGQR